MSSSEREGETPPSSHGSNAKRADRFWQGEAVTKAGQHDSVVRAREAGQ